MFSGQIQFAEELAVVEVEEWVGMTEMRELVQASVREGSCHPRRHLDELRGGFWFSFFLHLNSYSNFSLFLDFPFLVGYE